MGLAGPRKRTKISHDPNNTSWSRSTTNFGHKILTAQGWVPGTFLGAKNAPHAQFHSAASASHIRVALKDNNLGLGARRGSGQAGAECTGLSAFQGLLGRLNGKTEEEVGDEQKAREGIRREMDVEKRWGLIRFVKGGFLVGDKTEELMDDRTHRGNETEKRSANCDRLSRRRERGGTKKKHKDSGDSDGQGWPVGNNPKAIQVQGEEARSGSGKGRSRGSDDSGSSGLKARDVRKCSAKKGTKSHATTPVAIAQLSTISDLPMPEKEECERKVRRLKRRTRKGIKSQNEKGRTIESSSNQLLSLQLPFPDVTSAKSEKKRASAAVPTDIPRGRHVVRQRYIQQKKKALLDAQALNEGYKDFNDQQYPHVQDISCSNRTHPLNYKCGTAHRFFTQSSLATQSLTLLDTKALRRSMFATPIANDANVLSATTGLHPITLVRNVDWEHQANRLARFEGFPKQSKLVDLKQQAVDEAEYGGPGCRLGDKGWGVHWNPSVAVESDLKGLVERLGECRERLPVNDYTIMAGLKDRYRSISKPHGPGSGSESYAHSDGQPLALDGGTRPTFAAEKVPLIFDTVLISPPPLEVGTEMLRGLPIKELTAKPAFCFLWVRDSSEVELCSDIMQEWGFRSVERMAWFAAGSLMRDTQGEIESLDLLEGELFPLLKDLGFPNASSELGLCAEDFLSFTPLESGNGQATLSHCVATTAWGTGRTSEHFGSNYSPECLEPFHRTARFCLVGMNGKIKRSTDGHIVHSNIDPDVIISADCAGSPSLMYDVIENLALGRRRLHIFAPEASMRRGWVSVGPKIAETNFDVEAWESCAKGLGWLIRVGQEIEDLRPKSPPPCRPLSGDLVHETPSGQFGGNDGNSCWQSD